jgi:hypothetical protein
VPDLATVCCTFSCIRLGINTAQSLLYKANVFRRQLADSPSALESAKSQADALESRARSLAPNAVLPCESPPSDLLQKRIRTSEAVAVELLNPTVWELLGALWQAKCKSESSCVPIALVVVSSPASHPSPTAAAVDGVSTSGSGLRCTHGVALWNPFNPLSFLFTDVDVAVMVPIAVQSPRPKAERVDDTIDSDADSVMVVEPGIPKSAGNVSSQKDAPQTRRYSTRRVASDEGTPAAEKAKCTVTTGSASR